MINGGRAHLLDAPHLTVFPGLFLAIVVLGFNFLGDGLRDAIDPTKWQPRLRSASVSRDNQLQRCLRSPARRRLSCCKLAVVGLRRRAPSSIT